MTAPDQPRPAPGREDVSPVARERFLEAFDRQDDAGLERYGSRLQTNNGRSFARDAWEELVDLAKYLTGLEMERAYLLARAARLHALVAHMEGQFPPGHPDHRCSGCLEYSRER